MPVLKVIEIMASSPKNWEDATVIAIQTAAENIKGIRSVYIHHLSALVENNKISEYRVNAKVTYEVLN